MSIIHRLMPDLVITQSELTVIMNALLTRYRDGRFKASWEGHTAERLYDKLAPVRHNSKNERIIGVVPL